MNAKKYLCTFKKQQQKREGCLEFNCKNSAQPKAIKFVANTIVKMKY